ncbi:MAG: hemerythrin domain-containing protein [Acidimicrobiia bacterium]
MNALQLLKADHDLVRQMFEQFRTAHESDDYEAMGRISEEVFTELEVHTAIEEEVFYPAVREAGGGELNELTDESLEEHHVVDVLMAEIRRLDPSDDAFAAKMTVLIENVEHHAGEEEDEMFPDVANLLDTQALEALGVELEATKLQQMAQLQSRDELYQQASDLDIEGRSSMTKQELAKAVAERSKG